MSKIEAPEIFMIDDHGKLFRKGVHIGDLDGEKMNLHEGKKGYHAVVTTWLRKKADQEEAAAAEGVEKPVKAPLTSEQKTELDTKGMTAESVNESKKARAIYKDDVDFATRTNCPQPPKKNPQYGDKTPSFVDWLKRYRPEEFATRYGVKGAGKVPVFEPNANGVEEIVGYRDTEFSVRKNHLTDKTESDNGLSDDMDWNA